MAPRYRIISNGTTYRIQRRLLFVWWTLRNTKHSNYFFRDPASARSFIASRIDAWKKSQTGWKVVEDGLSDGLKPK